MRETGVSGIPANATLMTVGTIAVSVKQLRTGREQKGEESRTCEPRMEDCRTDTLGFQSLMKTTHEAEHAMLRRAVLWPFGDGLP